jgi:hypothetical protein
MTPTWVAPTIAVALVVIAASFLVIGGVTLAIGIAVRRQSRALRSQIAAFTTEAKSVTGRLRSELLAFADLSADARGRLKNAIETMDGHLKDLDALAEVLQQEAEETALDVAAFVRTVRRSGHILGVARRSVMGRRGSRG